jgi:hypothetical protein
MPSTIISKFSHDNDNIGEGVIIFQDTPILHLIKLLHSLVTISMVSVSTDHGSL